MMPETPSPLPDGPPTRQTVRQKMHDARGNGAWKWVTALSGVIKPWLATVFALLVMVAALVALRHNVVPQVTDIVNPASAGEVQRGAHYGRAFWGYEGILLCVFAACLWLRSRDSKRGGRLAPDLRAWLLGLAPFSAVCAAAMALFADLPVDWVMGGWFSLGAWLLGVTVLAQANRAQAEQDDSRKPGQILRANSPLPADRWIDRRLPRVRTAPQRFVVLVFLLWTLASLPAISTICYLWLAPGGEDSLDMHHLSFVCLLSLISLLSLTVGLWQLAKHERLGWPVPLLPWLPAWVLFLGFFAAWSPDNGKGLSGDGAQRPAPADAGYLFLGAAGTARDRRSDHPGPSEPLVLFSVSGGGSRAALFTAGIFSRMWWENDGGAYPGRDLLARADSLSSVSGGSLASAYLEEYLYRWMVNHHLDNFDPPKRLSPREACAARTAALTDFFDQPEFGSGAATGATRPYPVFRPPYRDEKPPVPLAAKVAQGEAPWAAAWDGRQAQKAAVQAFDDAPYVNAMRQDHVAASVAGFFQPWYGRGPNLEDFWTRSFGWDRAAGGLPRRVSQFRPLEQAGLLPALLLDSTITNSGTRLVITNVDQSCFAPSDKFGFAPARADLSDSDSPAGDPSAPLRRYDPLPFQINTLASLNPGWDIPLATAVRASANVPFAYPTIRFRRTAKGAGDRVLEPTDGGVLELTDGGVLDNTAVDATMALVRGGARSLAPPGGSAPRPLLIFQVDSGELPSDPARRWWDSLDHNLEEPQRAGWRANLNLQADVHSLYLEELCRIYGLHDRSQLRAVRMDVPLGPPSGKTEPYTLGFVAPSFAFFRVRAGELLGDHVTTTWHLPAPERYRLYRVVMAAQQGATIRAAAAWQRDPQGFVRRTSFGRDVRIERVDPW